MRSTGHRHLNHNDPGCYRVRKTLIGTICCVPFRATAELAQADLLAVEQAGAERAQKSSSRQQAPTSELRQSRAEQAAAAPAPRGRQAPEAAPHLEVDSPYTLALRLLLFPGLPFPPSLIDQYRTLLD